MLQENQVSEEETKPGNHQMLVNNGRWRWVSPRIANSLLCIIIFITVSFFFHASELLSSFPSFRHPSCPKQKDESYPITNNFFLPSETEAPSPPPRAAPTELRHLVFGIAASARHWEQRKDYIKLWWRPGKMRGFAWVDKPVGDPRRREEGLPNVRVSSSEAARLPYKNRSGSRSAVRISRIVSETLRLGLEGVRWFVMGDDDTVFFVENLVGVLSKYDHRQFYYIGGLSESHQQNIRMSYGMAFGGGGFAISYPLAQALAAMQDRCIRRYSDLYGSDERIHACMADLGVPLTLERGFHQCDVRGNLLGLLAAHPVAPLVSLHHLDVVDPIFPNASRTDALRRLLAPARLDSAAMLQQSICYDRARKWTISVSWGFAVLIMRGLHSAREMEMPSRTFFSWNRRVDVAEFSFNTRLFARNPCQKPFVFYLEAARYDPSTNRTITEYARNRTADIPGCRWKTADPSEMESVEVIKAPDPNLWNRAPRRNCCRVMASRRKKGSIVVDVGVCQEDEVSEI